MTAENEIFNLILNDDTGKAESLSKQKINGLELVACLLKKVRNKRPPLEKFKGSTPKFVRIATSYTCPHSCEMCINGFQDRMFLFEDRAYLTPEELDNLMPWIKSGTHVIFSGVGESLESPHIFDFLEKTHDKITTIITSGAPLNTKKIKLLIKSNLNFLHLSFDGKSSAGHGAGKDSYIRNFWEKVQQIQAIKKELKSKYPILGIQTTVNGENVDGLDEIFRTSFKHEIKDMVLLPMTVSNESLYKKSLYLKYEECKKNINRTIAAWTRKGMNIRIMGQHKRINDFLETCFFVDNWIGFPQDINNPAVCCGTIKIPLEITDYPAKKYWNSFPLRYFRFLQFYSEPQMRPSVCQTCWISNLKKYSNAMTVLFEEQVPGNDVNALYQKASKLKNEGQFKKAEETFATVLNLKPEFSLLGKIYFHLGEMKIMGKEYPKALSFMKLAVQNEFSHKKAFVYLYLLMMFIGDTNTSQSRKKATYQFCNEKNR